MEPYHKYQLAQRGEEEYLAPDVDEIDVILVIIYHYRYYLSLLSLVHE